MIKHSNLTQEQQNSLESLKENISNKEITLVQAIHLLVESLDNLDDLKNVEKFINSKMIHLKEEVLNNYIQQGKKLASNFGIETSQIVEGLNSTKTKNQVAIRYQDSDNPNNIWSGRGKRPIWLRKAIESGKKIEDYLV